MSLLVTPAEAPCRAAVLGLDLRQVMSTQQVAELRQHWLAHQVLAFPDQPMTVADLERFAATIGPFGTDPYFE